MWDPTFDFIDQTTCNQVGRELEKESAQRMQLYPLGNVVFYTQIPYIKSHVMSRLFQFMVADLGIQFTSSDYPERLMSKYTQVSIPVYTGPIPIYTGLNPSIHRSHSQYAQVPFSVCTGPIPSIDGSQSQYTQVSFPDAQHVMGMFKKDNCCSLVTLDVRLRVYLGFPFACRVWADRNQL